MNAHMPVTWSSLYSLYLVVETLDKRTDTSTIKTDQSVGGQDRPV